MIATTCRPVARLMTRTSPTTAIKAVARPLVFHVRAYKDDPVNHEKQHEDKTGEKSVAKQEGQAGSMMRVDPYSRYGRLPSIFHEMQREMDALTRGFGFPSLAWDDDMFMTPFRSTLFDDVAKVTSDVPAMRLATDVQEDDKAWTIKADIPGMSKDDIKLKLLDNTLTITGERKEEKREGEDKDRPVRYERRFGSFMRSFSLPKNVDMEGIQATAKDGVLTVTIPKVEEQQPQAKEIPVA